MSEASQDGFWATVGNLGNRLSVWLGIAPAIAAALTYVASKATVLGILNWADAILVAMVLTSLIFFAVAAMLLAWRKVHPDPSDVENKQMIILGTRAAIIAYNPAQMALRPYLHRNASYLRVRRHLSASFRRDLENDDGRTIDSTRDQDDLHPMLTRLIDELDRIARSWDAG